MRIQQIADAIFLKTNVSNVVGASKLDKIYRDVASDQAVPYRYGVYQMFTGEPYEYSYGATLALQGHLWLFKTVIDETAQASVSPQKFADTTLDSWLTTLGTSLTISGGGNVVWCEKFQDINLPPERLNNRWVFTRATLVRIVSN